MGKPVIETPGNARDGAPSSGFTNSPADFARANVVRIRLQLSFGFPLPETLEVASISYGLGASDDTMTLTWKHDAAKLDTEHFADMLARLPPDKLILAYIMYRKPGDMLFAGTPIVDSIQWTARSQGFRVTCLSDGQMQARHGPQQQIQGRYMLVNPDWYEHDDDPVFREVTTLAPIFNAGGKPNRQAITSPIKPGTRTYWISLFTEDDAPGAEYWSYGDALRHVVMFYGLKTGFPVNVNDFLRDTDEYVGQDYNGAAPDPFVRGITRRVDDNCSVQSANLDEALAILTDSAGLDYQIGMLGRDRVYARYIGGYRLRIFGRRTDPEDTVDQGRQQWQPGAHDLPRAKPFVDYTGWTPPEIAEFNACNTAQIEVDHRRITRPVFLGGHRVHEGAFLLRPGWLPIANLDTIEDGLETEAEKEAARAAALRYWIREFTPEYRAGAVHERTPRSIYHAEHPYHASVADVFRLWIFPDSAEIPAADLSRGDNEDEDSWVWKLSRYQPSDLEGQSWYRHLKYGPGFSPDAVDEWVARWRPFGNTIGRVSTKTTNLAPVVRIHFGTGLASKLPPDADDDGWRVVLANVDVDTRRAAIRFTEANIFRGPTFLADPNNQGGKNAITAYINRDFWVSITATVRGDQRMIYAPRPAGGGTLHRTQLVDLGFDRFRHEQRLAVYAHIGLVPADDDVAPYTGRDDTDALAAYGDRMAAEMAMPTVAGNASIFFLTRQYSPGDAITGVAGLGIEYERRPIVQRVTYTVIDGDVQTQLILTDLRGNPEVAP